MFPEIMTFFTNNANGIMYLMLFFIVLLFVVSYLSVPANKNNGKKNRLNEQFFSSYGKNIIFSFFLIVIVLFLFSLLGYSSAFSTSSSPNASPSFIDWLTGTRLFTFFSANGLSIINVVIIFLMFIVLFSMVGVNFNPPQNKTVQKVVEIEGFSCNLADPPENEKQCNLLSKTNCISTSCCGWLNGEKCVSSDLHHRNPNFLSDAQGNKIIVKTWCTSASCNE